MQEVDDVERRIHEEEDRGPVTEERAKRFAAGSHVLAHQRTRDRAFYLGWYELCGPGFAFDAERPRLIGASTPRGSAIETIKHLDSSRILGLRFCRGSGRVFESVPVTA